MPNRFRLILLLLFGAGAAAIMGYQRGFEIAVEKPAVEKSSVADRRREPHRVARSDKMAQLKALGGRSDRSHGATMKSWRIIRGFSVDEIRQALADLSVSREGSMNDWQLAALLHYRWAEIDPVSALESAIQSPGPSNKFVDGTLVFDAAMAAWMNRDPDAASRWIKSKPELADRANRYNGAMARVIAQEAPSDALDKASSESDIMRKSVGNILATKMCATPENRAKFLAELAKRGPTELAEGRFQMLNAWGRDDPKGALEGMAELGFHPSETAAKRQSILSAWTRYDPGSALTWMAGKPDALPLSTRTQLFTSWTQEDPDAAFKNFEALGNEPGFGEAVMGKLLLTCGHYMQNTSPGNSTWLERNQSSMQTFYRRWVAQSPEAATRWRNGLDPDLRKEIQP